ncbi:MAG: aldo/keto reductase [Acidimicrobiales bacterium]|nr:aldo/keto reductase [Acidimicrobiales bacterium]
MLNHSVVHEHVRRLQIALAHYDAALALGTGEELIETTCKFVAGEPMPANFPGLLSAALEALGLHPRASECRAGRRWAATASRASLWIRRLRHELAETIIIGPEGWDEGMNIVGLGTFPLSGVFSPVEQRDAMAVVAAFLDAGGSYIETAAVYPQDDLDLGKVLAAFSRESFFIATKCVAGRGKDGATVRSGRPEHIRQQCHDELRRLGVNNLDLLQLHAIPEDVPLEEAFGALVQLKDEGYTRFIGASNVSIDHLTTLLSVAHVDYVQNRFSFLHRRQHQSIEEACAENGVLLNPYQVIERGLLTDSPKAVFPESDLRRTKYEYSGEVYLAMRTWAETSLRDIATSNGLSVLELIVGWTALHPSIGVIPMGATTPEQVRQNVDAGTTVISPSIEAQLEQAYEDLETAVHSRVGLRIDEYRGL